MNNTQATAQAPTHPAIDALKPCPFCGAAPCVIDEDSYGKCHVFCVCEHEPSVQRWATHKAEAIAAWNSRAVA